MVFSGSKVLVFKGMKVINKGTIYSSDNWVALGKVYECFHRRSGYIHIARGASLVFDGKVTINSGARIYVGENATLTIKDSFINFDFNCHVTEEVRIESCVIAESVIIRDSSGHEFNGVNKVKPITLGPKVWIGLRSIIMPGTILSKDVVVAANTVVSGEFSEGKLIAADRGCVVKEGITWKR